ncbi:MAG TPA: Gfo/Idh/MocA family oxidoreductase [Terriglobales bacterium]|nr:Gfo/Idh/MocA family oxidoreductase [Terriglobales bacterium]
MSRARKIGYAVVGLGAIAQSSVLPAFAGSKRAKLVALVSRDRNKAARLAKKFGAGAFYSNEEYDTCLANPDIAAIYVATPPGVHREFTVRAARAGKHVLCEKPLAATVEQSLAMVEACARAGVLLMTAYRKYYEPSSLYLKQLVQNGDLGRIDVIHTSFSELPTPPSCPMWLFDPQLAGGGPLMDLGIYCVNTSRWLVEEDPVEVDACAWRHDTVRFREVEEGISFRMHFPSGLLVQGASTYAAAPSSFIYIQGTKGWVFLSPAFPFEEERWVMGKIAGRRVERKFKTVDEFSPQIDAFAASIQGGGPLVAADGMQGHRDIIILHAIYQSAKEQKPVVVRYESQVKGLRAT